MSGNKRDPFAEPVKPVEIGIAAVCGTAAGFTAKKLTKGAAIAVGLCFFGLQGLAHADLISINWNKLENLMVKRLDQNGDGKLTNDDFVIGASRIVHNLGSDLPSSASFAAAFWLGFRYG